jgi:hypothetical protein
LNRIDGFYPIVEDVSPDDGPLAGRTVTVKGKRFVSGSRVFFNGFEATNVQFVSDKELTVTVPGASLPRKVDVRVELPTSEWGTKYDGFEYKP